MKKITTKKGFTIVEVTLSLSFLSVLLITIAALTIHVTSVYQKGLSIKAVTSTGRELVDEFTRAISSSPAIDVEGLCNSSFNTADNPTRAQNACKDDGASLFVNQTIYDNIEGINGSVPIGGIFCTGRYSYLWNSGYILKNNSAQGLAYKTDVDNSITGFRLLKITDTNNLACRQAIDSNNYAQSNIRSYYVDGNPVYEDILAKSEDNLALYRLDVFPPAYNTTTMHGFYSGTFILGTVQGGVDITANGDYCKDEASLNLDTDFNYCAINKFNFATRATGESKQ